jgi:hypothetical protein
VTKSVAHFLVNQILAGSTDRTLSTSIWRAIYRTGHMLCIVQEFSKYCTLARVATPSRAGVATLVEVLALHRNHVLASWSCLNLLSDQEAST